MEQKELIKEINVPLLQAKGWMKLLGVMLIIYGIAVIFSIVGILFCWIPIWMGVLLFKAGNKFETVQATGQKELFVGALYSLKKYFTIAGVLLLVSLIAIIIGAIAGGGFIAGIIEMLQ